MFCVFICVMSETVYTSLLATTLIRLKTDDVSLVSAKKFKTWLNSYFNVTCTVVIWNSVSA